MNTDELRVLARRADGVEGRPDSRLDEVHTKIRRTRQRRATGWGAGALAVLLVLGVGATLVDGDGSRSRQPVEPAPTPAPTETRQVPLGQRTLSSRVGREGLRGWTVLATASTDQPEHRGAAELTIATTVHSETTYYSFFCHADDPAVWFFLELTDGGAAYGRCDAGSAALPPPDLPETPDLRVPTATSFRMLVTRLSPDERACYLDGDQDCRARFGPPEPTAGTGAELGLRVFDPPPARTALSLFAGTGSPPEQLSALSSIRGDAWLVDRAVLAAPGADHARVQLAARDVVRLVDVYSVSVGRERCARQHADELPDRVRTDHLVYDAAVDRVCGVDLRLVVDGTTVPRVQDPLEEGHFGALGSRLPPGAHTVEVDVVRGDPRDVRYALVLRDHVPMP